MAQRKIETKKGDPSLVISCKTAYLLGWHRFHEWVIQCEYYWNCKFHPKELELDDSKLSLSVFDRKPAPRLETLQTWLKEKHGVDAGPDEKSLYEALLSVTPKEHIEHEVRMRSENGVFNFNEKESIFN